ncbi:TSUP family transporter [Glaciimonas sp. PCH181]|uniref:sulfite exporter TauE/SafE family protein n=1 Tax=Glaciimonas sp. PCH181 TaxID=2133943 RepID=UPI000D345C69|nr:TSUP family transporter [Glaciimonas sp. PCH181]PUA17906.1 hypothetical protein C7W93_18815 [Glaciimonas sp. PCH181]
MLSYALLAVAGFLAGLIDAVVGWGGLIQIPAIFSILPTTAPATTFGTNKLAGIFGTSAAAVSFGRRVKMAWSAVVPAATGTFLFSFLGTVTVTHIPIDAIRRALLFILLVVAILIGCGIGFYDGLFGPGRGSALIFLFIRVFNIDFKNRLRPLFEIKAFVSRETISTFSGIVGLNVSRETIKFRPECRAGKFVTYESWNRVMAVGASIAPRYR